MPSIDEEIVTPITPPIISGDSESGFSLAASGVWSTNRSLNIRGQWLVGEFELFEQYGLRLEPENYAIESNSYLWDGGELVGPVIYREDVTSAPYDPAAVKHQERINLPEPAALAIVGEATVGYALYTPGGTAVSSITLEGTGTHSMYDWLPLLIAAIRADSIMGAWVDIDLILDVEYPYLLIAEKISGSAAAPFHFAITVESPHSFVTIGTTTVLGLASYNLVEGSGVALPAPGSYTAYSLPAGLYWTDAAGLPYVDENDAVYTLS